jgi:pyruvate,water dikinase
MSAIVWLDAPEARDRHTGGKGASLVALNRHGFPVPPGFVIAAEGYQRFVVANDLAPEIERLLATPDLRLPAVCREAVLPLVERLERATLPPDLAAEVGAAHADLRRRGGGVVAVRSSALSEDGAGASSAGLYDTYLNLRTPAAVLDAVRRCYASLWTRRAVQYRAVKGLDGRAEAMAVVVMALVPAETAGVAFTANPVTGDRDQIVINASWGLGEAVVSGRVTPDTFVLDKRTLAVIARQVFPKEIEVVPDPAGASGTVQRAVGADRASRATLDDECLQAIGEICRRIESCFAGPMDVEWAISQGSSFYVLQARPVTGLT